MAAPTLPNLIDRSSIVIQRVHAKLLEHAFPDARFGHDFTHFVPDFRDSSCATDRVLQLPCYKSADTILITPDNSVEKLRCAALKDGKKVLVATHRIRRGFVLLEPRRIEENKYELASCLDGMEKPGNGRHVTLAQMQEEGIVVGLFVTGASVINTRGAIVGKSHNSVEMQWLVLMDRDIINEKTPFLAVVHDCQIVDEEEQDSIIMDRNETWDMRLQCDHIVTPTKVMDNDYARKLEKKDTKLLIEHLSQETLSQIPPLQELKGIHMMEQIMKGVGTASQVQRPEPSMPDIDRNLGISMVEKIMKGYKV